jgi:hypothetical protein
MFRTRREVLFRGIVKRCREDVADVKGALAMGKRVAEWLGEREVKIWH